MDEVLIIRVSKILGISENTVQWDLSETNIIKRLVEEFEKLAFENEVDIYE
jgi:hypothetical protein